MRAGSCASSPFDVSGRRVDHWRSLAQRGSFGRIPAEGVMSAFNAVRFREKPGREQEFLNAHKNVHQEWPGLTRASIIKTGEHLLHHRRVDEC
jgi:hypothetical protein